MAVAAGDRHTVALKNDGTVLAWGFNVWGQVTGTSTTDEPYSAMASPVILEGQVLSNLTAIAVGSVHTVALKNDGTVVAWGANYYGQVTGTTTSNSPSPQTAIASPVTMGGQVLSGVTAIAAGTVHTVALRNDGSVVAWGDNAFGQTIVPFAAQSGVTAIAAGRAHTVALKNNGTVVAWGTYNGTNVPVGLNGVTAIAAGSIHTLALKSDGTLVAWGDNDAGQVNGIPTTVDPNSATACTSSAVRRRPWRGHVVHRL
jgi:alpha-tubulin suppressor-like RCC1 family protein